MRTFVRRWVEVGAFLLALSVLPLSAQGLSAQENSSVATPVAALPAAAQSAISAALSREIPGFVQRAKLTASDAVKLDSIGVSVAISASGNTVAVGMASTHIPGAVYVFTKPATGWTGMTQTAKLTASDGASNDYLGYSVSISGDNTVIAGAPNAHNYQGAAYVFVKPAGGWINATQTAELTASDTGDAFGSSVAISGNTVVAGATDGNSFLPGAAYAFVKPASGWVNMTQTAELTPSDGQDYDIFGCAVAISGNTIVAGTNGQDKAYLFVKPSTGWTNMTQTARLNTPQGGTSLAVGISGNTVVAGSPYVAVGSNSEQGAAYVFVKPASGWTDMSQTATLTASDGAAESWLGYGVSINGNAIVAGAPFTTVGSNTTQGAAYTFIEPSTGWATTSHFNAKIVESVGAKNDQFGWSVSQNKNTVLVGAPGVSGLSGAAYIFGQ